MTFVVVVDGPRLHCSFRTSCCRMLRKSFAAYKLVLDMKVYEWMDRSGV